MAREGIRHLLVLDDDRELVGVVTDRDLRRPTVNGEVMTIEKMYKVGDSLKVSDVMTDGPMTVDPDMHTTEAARIMVENKFNCCPSSPTASSSASRPAPTFSLPWCTTLIPMAAELGLD